MIDKKEKYYAMKILRNQIGSYVYPIHRLDKPTSGILIFALSSEAANLLSKKFFDKNIQKTYYAIARGYVGNGIINHPLKEKLDKMTDKKANKNKPPQEAITRYETIKTVELPFSVGKYNSVRYSLVKLNPLTGRKHQLRRHLKHISHHILGDTKYGRGEHNKFIREKFNIHRMLLHCYEITLKHPYTNETISLKADFDENFLKLFKHFNWKIQIT
jgi:tRNA pseudouridine65 synthase